MKREYRSLFLSFVLAVLVLPGCTLSPAERVAWAKDYSNGLHVSSQQAGYSFDLQYTPEWFLHPEGNNNVEGGSGLQQYLLEIVPDNSSVSILEVGVHSLEEFQERTYYYSYQFEHDVFLEEGGKTFPCLLFHFENGGDLVPQRRFVLGFEDTSQAESAELVIKSSYLDALPIRIKISKTYPN